jgi:predicted dehydrogenase
VGHGLTRAAVLGQGSIGRRHAGNLRDLGLEVVTYDPADPAGASSEIEALRGADVCVVASPSSEHARHARLAIEAGVPALVEKPLALDAAEARALEELGGDLAVAMNLRFHPGVLGLRDGLAGAGRVLRADVWCGSYLPGWRASDYRESYSARADLGGGVLLDAIHEIDYLTWLLGPVAAVRATLARVSELEIDVEDTALLTLEMVSGALATVRLDYYDRAYHRGARIVGADATVSWDWTDPSDAGATYVAELQAFLDGGPRTTVAEARHALEVVDAARRSAAAGGARTVI